jgi:hypothetical protein
MATSNGRKAKKFRIRITGFETKPASAFKFNALNWRRHGDDQRAALRTMLGDVGWVQGVIENKRTGNLIDGHARIEAALADDPQQAVPYLVVDLSPAEEKAVLATLDPIGAMAETDPEVVAQLYKETIADMPALEELLTSLHYEDEPDDSETADTKTVEFRQTYKIVIECSSVRQQKKIGRLLDQQGIEYSAK